MRGKRAAVVLAAVAVASVLGSAATPVPAGGDTTVAEVPGLERPARIVRDRNGVQHITARTDRDAFFLQGWVHAEDRLFQMDLSRRQASGRRAELLGPDLLADDIQLRTVGVRRGAERSLDVLSDDARAVLDAYAAGVNAWVAAHPLPSEYAEVEVSTFEPWTPVDSLAVAKLIAFGLSFDVDIFPTFDLQAYRDAGATNGFDGDALYFEDAFRVAPFEPAATLPDAGVAPPFVDPTGPVVAPPYAGGVDEAAAAKALDARSSEALRRWTDALRSLPSWSAVFDPGRLGDSAGSNEWGVTGAVTDTGRPIMANDPHLALDLPPVFYPVALRSPSYDVVGESFAGAPSVILGHNRDIAWGATTISLDVTDAYREQLVADPASPSGRSTVYQGRLEPVVAIPEVFRANTRGNGVADDLAVVAPGTEVPGSQLGPVPAETLVVPRRNNGPLVLGAFSLQYTGFSGTRELETFLRWNRAEGLEDFRDGLRFFDVGGQNWSYVDTDGNLGYFTSGEVPLREDLEAGAVEGLPPWFLRDGSGGNEWVPDPDPAPDQAIPFEVLPYEEMPQAVNPPAGYFVNANNDPSGAVLDNDPLDQRRPSGGIYYLNNSHSDGLRAGRITRRLQEELAGDGTVSFEDMQSIQADVELLDAEVLLPYVSAAFDRAATPGAPPALAALAADARVAEAMGRLRAWDFTSPTGVAEGYDAADVGGSLAPPSSAEVAASVATTIWSVWRGEVLRDVVDATLAPYGVPTPGSGEAVGALRNLLDGFGERQGRGASGLDFFAAAGGGLADPADRRDHALLRSLADALDLLAGDRFADAFGGSTDQDDYRWGRLHRVSFDHPLGGARTAPPAGGYATPAGLSGIATDGGFGTPDASGHGARADADDEFGFGGGPVRRYVGEPRGGRIRGESALPGGASGRVESPWYVNLLGPWLTNDSYRQELVARGASEVVVLRPPRGRR